MKKLNLLLVIFILFAACNNLNEAKKVLKNEKTSTTYEFLVKKKEPLTMPPDFEKLPLPDSATNKPDLSEEEKIKKILKLPEENLNKNKNKNSSSIEDSIIEQIR